MKLAVEEARPRVMKSEKPVAMERVSEYQVFTCPIWLTFQVIVSTSFPEMQKLSVKEVIRIEEGNEVRVLK